VKQGFIKGVMVFEDDSRLEFMVPTRLRGNQVWTRQRPLRPQIAVSEFHRGKEIEEIQAGVYKVSSRLICPVIILVLNQMPQDENNALWQLFSGKAEGFEFGHVHYQWHDPNAKSLLNQLYKLYLKEGVVMPYTWDDYYRDYARPFIESLPIEEKLRGVSHKEILKEIPDEERLEGIPLEKRLEDIPPELIKKYLSTLS
jgi:hypothetical protein